MTQQDIMTQPSGASLPVERRSGSELLEASHLLIVRVASTEADPWTAEDADQERRELRMRLHVVDLLKGPLLLAPDRRFELAVDQLRGGPLAAPAYRGFWSHATVESGSSYLVVALGEGSDPAVLMQEPSIRSLLPGEYAEDVREAIRAEQAQVARLGDPAHRDRAVSALLERTMEKRAALHHLFGDHLWVRIQDAVLAHDEYHLDLLLPLISAADANPGLRASLLKGLYSELSISEPRPEPYRRFLACMLRLLEQPEAAPMHDYLGQAWVHNIVFRDDRPPPAADRILPDSEERARIAARFRGVPDDRAQKVADWLQGGGS